jgi:hypothetical protein
MDSHCKALNPEELANRLRQMGIQTRPHLFSSTMVFVSEKDATMMTDSIQTIEKVIQSDSYQRKVHTESHEVSHFNPGPRGVFMGYDFHLTGTGPKLIEINTNAGGLLLNAELAKAQSSCSGEASPQDDLEEIIFQTIVQEWTLQRGDKKLSTVAVVDENPKEQFLYPEFLLFQRLFEQRGVTCDILSPDELTRTPEGLKGPHGTVDLIYNRLTDFYLERTEQEHIKEAYLSGAVVLTPNPHHHALFARKTNLITLRDSAFLKNLELSKNEVELLLETIPESRRVDPAEVENLWARRKEYFFKPIAGFGSRGSYRGDKVTRRVWGEISRGNYVAQEIVPPSIKRVDVDGCSVELKVDIRAYTYNSQVILFAARLYAGQTTNFRTEGGGFAPVFTVP